MFAPRCIDGRPPASKENYGSVLKDCSEAIKLNPHSSKAYFRSATALVALERLEEALDCCDRCLQFDKDNAAIKSLREKTYQSKKAKDEKQKQREEKLKKERAEQAILSAAYQVGPRPPNLYVNRSSSLTIIYIETQSDHNEEP